MIKNDRPILCSHRTCFCDFSLSSMFFKGTSSTSRPHNIRDTDFGYEPYLLAPATNYNPPRRREAPSEYKAEAIFSCFYT